MDDSLWSMFQQGYDALVDEIIQPPKYFYLIKDLGPTEFTLYGKEFEREDLRVTSRKGRNLQCSHWYPTSAREQLSEVSLILSTI
jgi:hypothetical protein